MTFRRVRALLFVSLQLVLFTRNLDFVRPLSHEYCSCNANIQPAASPGSKMATPALFNTKRSFDKQLRYSIKQSKRRTLCYANSTAAFHVLIALRFDIEEILPQGCRLQNARCVTRQSDQINSTVFANFAALYHTQSAWIYLLNTQLDL